MPLKRLIYDVYLADGAEHRVEVTHGDQLRGELEGRKQGLPPLQDAPMNATTVWVWCAMARLGLYSADYRQFSRVDLLGFDQARDEHGEPVAGDVDPTPPAHLYDSGSHSAGSTAVDRLTGSTPTSTTT